MPEIGHTKAEKKEVTHEAISDMLKPPKPAPVPVEEKMELPERMQVAPQFIKHQRKEVDDLMAFSEHAHKVFTDGPQ